MLKSLWEKIKAPFRWLKRAWDKFNDWVATWAPGFKTKIVAFLGAVGSFAAASQDYFTNIPLDKFVSATSALIITGVLFSLAFWFRGLTSREKNP